MNNLLEFARPRSRAQVRNGSADGSRQRRRIRRDLVRRAPADDRGDGRIRPRSRYSAIRASSSSVVNLLTTPATLAEDASSPPVELSGRRAQVTISDRGAGVWSEAGGSSSSPSSRRRRNRVGWVLDRHLRDIGGVRRRQRSRAARGRRHSRMGHAPARVGDGDGAERSGTS